MIKSTETRFIFSLGSIKISIKKNVLLIPLYILSNYLYDILISKDIKQIQRKRYNYVSLGSYCFSRVITTYNKLKPTKNMGEKTMPFDLAFSLSIDSVAHLIETDFKDFFKNLKYDKNKKYYVNDSINMVYNHDGELSIEQFKQRYENRIKNLYEIFEKAENHVFFIIATFEAINKAQIDNLIRVINKFMSLDKFDIILINQNEIKTNLINNKNLYIIEQAHNINAFNKINIYGDWAKELKRRDSFAAIKIYYEVTSNLIKIIKSIL